MEPKGRPSREDIVANERNAASGDPVFSKNSMGSNALLTAAAAIVPLFILGVASLTSLADRRRQTRTVRLPKR